MATAGLHDWETGQVPSDQRPLGERLQSLYEDAVCSPGFTFRGPAIPLVIAALTEIRELAPPPTNTGVEVLLEAARRTGQVATDALAEVIGAIFLETFLSSEAGRWNDEPGDKT